MSKLWVPVYGYGLVFDTEEMEEMAEEREIADYVLADKFGFTEFCGFDGIIYQLADTGSIITESKKEVQEHSFYILYCEKMETVFNNGYENFDELIAEIKEKTKELFPEGYDYCSHIQYVSGVIFDD